MTNYRSGNRTENRNTATQIYQLRFDKEAKASQQRKDSVSKKGVGTNTHAKKKKKSRHRPYTFYKN